MRMACSYTPPTPISNTHIKYCLQNGDCGIIKTIDHPVYITKVLGNTLFCLDRNGENRPIVIDSTEYILKSSLHEKRYDDVMSMLRNSELCGQAIITYLQQKCFPEIAFHSIKDEKTINNEKAFWDKIAAVSVRQGHVGMAERLYKKTRNFDRLAFLYLITGNLSKLSGMMRTAMITKDLDRCYLLALYLGETDVRADVLARADLSHLALAAMKAYGYQGLSVDVCAKMMLDEGPRKGIKIPAPPRPVSTRALED